MNVNEELIRYVEREILPRYDAFDRAHRRDHALTVIAASLRLARYYEVNPDMVYAVAAYHDTGLREGRGRHHEASARIVRGDRNLRRWFTEAEVATIAEAAEDHRASSGRPPRTIYGRIVAEADRVIDCETTLRRTVQYGLEHAPELDREGQFARFAEHLRTKYGEGGYLRLWLPESEKRLPSGRVACRYPRRPAVACAVRRTLRRRTSPRGVTTAVSRFFILLFCGISSFRMTLHCPPEPVSVYGAE